MHSGGARVCAGGVWSRLRGTRGLVGGRSRLVEIRTYLSRVCLWGKEARNWHCHPVSHIKSEASRILCAVSFIADFNCEVVKHHCPESLKNLIRWPRRVLQCVANKRFNPCVSKDDTAKEAAERVAEPTGNFQLVCTQGKKYGQYRYLPVSTSATASD